MREAKDRAIVINVYLITRITALVIVGVDVAKNSVKALGIACDGSAATNRLLVPERLAGGIVAITSSAVISSLDVRANHNYRWIILR